MAIPPDPPRQHRRRPRGVQALAWFAGIGVVLGLFVLTRMGEQQRFAVRRMDPIRRKPAPAPQHPPPSARQGSAAHNDQAPPAREQHHKALALVDSALQSSADPGRAIRFYRMALSFNRYNVHAWYGLIEAYGEAGLHREAAQTRREMQEVLGQRSFSLASLVAPVGTAVSLTTTDLGTVRLEYRSRATDRGELLREVWQLSRSLGRDCNCRALSLHATTESGTGVLVHIDAQSVPGDLASFQSAASITFLE